MKTKWVVGLASLALVVSALAQEPGAGRPERPAGQQGRGGGAMGTPLEMATRLGETLNLTDAQKPKFDALIAKYKPQFEAQAGQREKMMELARQMREARQSGDQAKADDLRKQMDQLREGSSQVLTQFTNELEPMLTPEQVTTLKQFRDRMTRRGGANPEQVLDRLPEELKLTDEQKTKFTEMLAKYRAQAQEIRPLRDQLRQARQANETARVAELEKQIKEKGGEESADSFMVKLDPMLTDEQRAKLADAWVRLGGGPDSARGILQAAQRLGLKEEQRGRLRQIARDVMQQMGRGEQTPEKRTELATATKTKVLAVLDDKQKAEFEQQLQNEQRPGRGGRRGPGGEQAPPAESPE